MASSSSDHGLGSCNYDVFVSFRGPDTRNNFISHLYEALLRKKIEVYKDDVSLPQGDEISPALLKAIESSKASIVVLSKNYAASSWCLDELVHILKCMRERSTIVLPVFYGVDRSDVLKQQGTYASAFDKHEDRFKDEVEKVVQWRSALAEAGSLHGWVSCQNGNESELVQEIAQATVLKLCNLSSTSYDELSSMVGIEARCKQIESLLRLDSTEVRTIGIWGMGGIGKSTLADAIQKRLAPAFESWFFVNVSNELKRRRCELRDINQKMISSLLNDRDVDKDYMNNCFTFVRLRRTKVLVVLDNVDDVKHLEQLIGFPDQTKYRFGDGSRILITSRDKRAMGSVDGIYEVDPLKLDEATQLFYQFAFRGDSSKIIDFVNLSKSVVDYAGGNPLALRVLGSHLRMRSVKEWKSVLSKLEKAPNQDIQDVLTISYDGLDHLQQSTFLDIACYLIGEDRELVEDILGEDYSHIDVSVLIERSLISISNGYIQIHDLIQAMAWEVARKESMEVGKPIRLRDAQDVCSVLKQDEVTTRVEGVCLDLSRIRDDLCLRSTAFEGMKNLRFLNFYRSQYCDKNKLVYFDEGLACLSNSLRYIHWESCPLKSLPSRFNPQHLVKLNLSESKLEKLWDGVQHLGNLKHIDLSYSYNMIELPDLSLTSKLAHLDLNACYSLCQLPKITGNLSYLDLSYCVELSSLQMLPRNLQALNLNGCDRLSNLYFVPVWQMILDLDSLTNLKLHLSSCSISHIRDSFNLLSSLETLEIWRGDFEKIPSSIKHMKKLKHLLLCSCDNLQSLSDLPPSLKVLVVGKCESLKMISVFGLMSLRSVIVIGCESVEEFGIDELGCTSWEELPINCDFKFGQWSKLKHSSQDNILTLFQRGLYSLLSSFLLDFDLRQCVPTQNESSWAFACYGGNEIPNWFTYQSEGSLMHVSLEHNFISIAVSVVFEAASNVFPMATIKTRCGSIVDYERWVLPTFDMFSSKEEFKPYVVLFHYNPGYFDELNKKLQDDAIEAAFEFELNNEVDEAEIKIKKWGIHIINLEEVQEFQTQVEHLRRRKKQKVEILEGSSHD